MSSSNAPKLDLDWASGDPEALRRAYAAERAGYLADAPADVTVEQLAVLGVGGLLFTPPDPASDVPIVYFHGGGWLVGSPDTHRTACAHLARASRQRVISVRYRLAPEHPFPAQKVDALAALNAVLSGRIARLPRPQRLILAGDSAGAAVAMWAEAGAPPAVRSAVERIISFYGAFGLRDSDSLRRLGPQTPGLSAADMAGMYARLGPALPIDMRQSFRAGGAPLTLLVAGADPLADDSRTLALWCADGGRAVTLIEAEGMPHGFLHTVGRDPQAMSWMRKALGQAPGNVTLGG